MSINEEEGINRQLGQMDACYRQVYKELGRPHIHAFVHFQANLHYISFSSPTTSRVNEKSTTATGNE